MIETAGLTHLGLYSEDRDGSVKFYQTVSASSHSESIGAIRGYPDTIKRGEYDEDELHERYACVWDPDGYILELNARRVLLSRKQADA